MTSLPLFQNIVILKRPRVAIFDDIIKIVNIFIKTIFKESKEVKRISKKLCIKMESTTVFLDVAKFTDFRWKNADVSRTPGVRQVIHITFQSSLGKL